MDLKLTEYIAERLVESTPMFYDEAWMMAELIERLRGEYFVDAVEN